MWAAPGTPTGAVVGFELPLAAPEDGRRGQIGLWPCPSDQTADDRAAGGSKRTSARLNERRPALSAS